MYLKNKPRRYRNWLTKQVNGACGCHGHMSKWLRKERNREIKDERPSCGEPESSTHATICEDPDRAALYRDSVSKVEQWMQKSTTEPGLRSMLVSYLKTWQSSDEQPATKRSAASVVSDDEQIRKNRWGTRQTWVGLPHGR